jgi:hypothetical protein
MKQKGRGRTRGKVPKVVSLTKALEATIGTDGRQHMLDDLIAEQETDSEPSPLDNATRRKVWRGNEV